MANYGDVALDLQENWDRTQFDNLQYGTVGHAGGVPDVCLKDSPEERHQFYWCDIKDMQGMNSAIQKGYKLVHKDTWTKNVSIWDWDAQGHLINGYGDGALRLMARPAARFFADEERREEMWRRAGADHDADLDAVPRGFVATDARGNDVKRRGPRRKR